MPRPMDALLGRLAVEKAWLTPAQVESALRIRQDWGRKVEVYSRRIGADDAHEPFLLGRGPARGDWGLYRQSCGGNPPTAAPRTEVGVETAWEGNLREVLLERGGLAAVPGTDPGTQPHAFPLPRPD